MTILASSDYKQQINEILEDDALTNADKLDALDNIFEVHSFQLEPSEIAAYYHDISKIFYRERDLTTAIRCLERAVVIRRKFASENTEPLRKSLKNLGLFHRRNAAEFKSLQAYKEILDYGKDDAYAAKVYIELGAIYSRAGDFDKALNYYNRAIRFFEKNDDARNLYLAHLQSSYTYTQMDRVEFSEEILEHLSKCDAINLANDSKIMRGNESLSIHLRRGNLLLEQQSYADAEQSLNQALLLATANKDSTNVSILYNSLGKLHIDTKAPDKAHKNLKLGLKHTTSPVIIAMIHNNFGDHYEVMGAMESAEVNYLKSLSLLVGNSQDNFPSIDQLRMIPNKLDALFYLKDVANFYVHSNEIKSDQEALEKALAVIYLADNLVDIIRNESTEHVSKLFWRSHSADLYMKGVEVSVLLNDTEAAYYFMEKNKVLLLLEDISEQQAKTAANIPDVVLLKELRLEEAITAAETNLVDIHSQTGQDQIKNIIFERKQTLQLLRDSISVAFPKYSNLKSAIEIKTLAAVRDDLLGENKAIIEFMLDDEKGFIFFISASEVHLYEIENIGQLHKDIVAIRAMISKPFYNESEFISFNTLAQSLYNQLFSQVDAILRTTAEIIIVPDGPLLTIPFEILQPKATINPLRPNYLLDQSAVSYCLSLSHLLQNNGIKRQTSENFLGIAPVEFQDNTLEVLDESKAEIDSVYDLVGGRVLHQEEATKATVIAEMERYMIIHIATHANYDSKQHPWLWFYDEKLPYTELVGLQSQAEMVVLSACKTLQGAFVKGEGLLSLSRGFLKSGSNSVVASLWNANDKSNREIMVDFYKYLGKDQPKNIALSRAKVKYLEMHQGVESSPFYWAPSVLTGNADSLSMHAEIPWQYILLAIGAIAFIGIYFRKQSKS